MALYDIIDAQWLRETYLVGINLTDDRGKEYPARVYDHAIRAAVSEWEARLSVKLEDVATLTERRDVLYDAGESFYLIDVDWLPLREITRLAIGFGAFPEVELPLSWAYVVSEMAGQIQIIPGPESLERLVFQSGNYAHAFLFQPYRRYTPGWMRITYKAGFGGDTPGQADKSRNDATNYVYPWDELLLRAIGITASLLLLDTAGDLIVGAGIASKSISIPGLSQSINTTCLAGSSRVLTANGERTIAELADGGPVDVMSYDGSCFVRAGAINARRTGGRHHHKEMVEVEFDTGRSIRCTTEHLFLRAGLWVPAGELVVGDRMTAAFDRPRVVRVDAVDTEPVYDLEVPGLHCFVAEGVVVHNSSATNAGYGARLLSSLKQLKESVSAALMARYKPMQLAVIG